VQRESSLTVKIENSNHPKTEQDRSGHGIGLQQVQKRLDLSYPNRYQWEKGVSEGTYYSHIVISL
jgi:LytS/YehU family sensor histidine kinase